MQVQQFLRCGNATAAMQVQHQMPQCSTAAAPPPMEKVTPPMEKVTDGKGQGGASQRRGVVFAPGSTTPPMEKVTAAGASPPMEKVTPSMEKVTEVWPWP